MALALTLAVVAGGVGCGRRSAESKAAERAQDACIGSLSPVADNRQPSAAVLDAAVADAEAAASVDERWQPLLARLRAARQARGTPAVDPAIDALVEECDRVNDIVRSGGRKPASA